jgi:hypothetical protein
MTSTLEVLHVPDCPNLPPLLERLRVVTGWPVTTREIHTTAEAEAAGMAGSPTLLVNGRDPFRPADGREREFGVSCRIYRDEHGRAVPVPSVGQLRAALADAVAGQIPASSGCSSGEPGQPGAVLSARRTRAQPLDPVEKAVHQRRDPPTNCVEMTS